MIRKRAWAAAAGACLVVPAPLLFAGEPAWSIQLIAAAAMITLAALMGLHRRAFRVSTVDLVVLGAVVWTAFQLVPLPTGWADPVVLRGRELVGLHGWVPLSLDPGATRERLLVMLIAAAAFYSARLTSAVAGRRVVLYLVGASCAVMALVAFGHELLGATRVFGMYAPIETTPALMAPILNANQLGGFLAFGSAIWLGLAISASKRGVALGDGAMGLLCAMGALGSGSRGAALGVALGFAFVLYLALRRSGGAEFARGRRVLIVAGALGVALALFSVLGLSELGRDIVDGEYSKLTLIRDSFALTLYRPLVGLGRGAFEAAFASGGSASVRFTHPENIVIQWAAEWGWAFTLLVASVWLPLLGRSLKADKPYLAAAGGAVAIFIVHDMFDFALEMAGVLGVFMFALGALVPKGGRRISLRSQGLAMGALTACAVFAGLGLGERRVTAVLSHAEHVGPERAEAFARSVIKDHPADPLASLGVGIAFSRHDHTGSLRWLNRTMELAPEWSAPHEIASNVLARRGALPQALLESFEAERRRSGSSGETLCWLAETMSVEALIAIGAPRSEEDRHERLRFSDKVSSCLQPEKRSAFDELLIAQGASPGALLRRARQRWRSGDAAGSREDLDSVREEDRNLNYSLLRARVIAEDESPMTGIQLLDALEVEPGSPEEWRILSTRAALCGVAEDSEMLESTLEELRRHAAGDPANIAKAWAIAGAAYRAMDEPEAAFAAYQRANQLDPSENSYIRVLAGLARRQGLTRRAAEYLRTLCQRGEIRACE